MTLHRLVLGSRWLWAYAGADPWWRSVLPNGECAVFLMGPKEARAVVASEDGMQEAGVMESGALHLAAPLAGNSAPSLNPSTANLASARRLADCTGDPNNGSVLRNASAIPRPPAATNRQSVTIALASSAFMSAASKGPKLEKHAPAASRQKPSNRRPSTSHPRPICRSSRDAAPLGGHCARRHPVTQTTQASCPACQEVGGPVPKAGQPCRVVTHVCRTTVVRHVL